MRRTQIKETTMHRARLKEGSEVVIEAMNFLQREKGYVLDEALMCALFAIGIGLKQRGVDLLYDDTLREQLAPLFSGYAQADLMKPEQRRPEWGAKH